MAHYSFENNTHQYITEIAKGLYEQGEEAEKIQLPCFLPYESNPKRLVKIMLDPESFLNFDSPPPAPIIDNKSRLKNPHRIEVILEHRKWQSNFLRNRDNQVLAVPFSTDKSLLKKQMVRSLIGLKPITLREMHPKKDHVYDGYVLSVTIIEQAYSWIPSIHLVIEDQHFDCKKICVYGFPEDQGEHLISQVLTIGSKMHIINPYLRLGKIDLKPLIRIDDFSSIVMQNESEHIINMCRCCGEANARHVCSKCKRAYYCTRECQIMDWQLYKHKLICKNQ
jgi:hypothetical protein